ncbi:MAG: ExeM/NucH family extracellular endonuclease [Ardenticatenaceae bacterium]|nr:ExeM/NucH family extracellular endonuclease [Anaerolineales bacterium]MCB8939480.1 ExeM/NucH family extracellular endonuclease [Ardenticatenaceae bacterium]MCB8975696.1 ExeM/NucH family extracellular endonuclease [Ardenticatenaceae bacterium]
MKLSTETQQTSRRVSRLLFLLLVVAGILSGARAAHAISPDIVISQVYGGGGNSGAVYTHDFIELFNRGTTTVSLAGWSVQYASATGSGSFGSSTTLITPLSGSLAPGQYLLVQEATNAAVGSPLPTPDVTDSTPINMSGTGGKVALVLSTTGLGCNGGSTPCSAAQLALIQDLVGWDGANFYETAAAPATTNSTAVLRLANGCTETDNNALDFAASTPTPRNTASPLNPCTPTDAAPEVIDTFPINGATDFPINANLTVTFSEPVNVSSNWFTLTCSISGPSGVPVSFSGGPTDFTIDPGVPLVNSESCTLTILANQVTDQDGIDPPDNMVMNFVVGFSPYDVCTASFTPIYAIQGSGLSAAITGMVTTKGVVVGDFEGSGSQSGFYIQDLTGDGDGATSDGIFVYTGSANLVSAGQVVRVTGYARERFSQTTLNGSNSNSSAVSAANIVPCGSGSVAPTDVTMPFADATYLERFEGMAVRFPQPLVISEYFNYDRFGEMVLALPLAGESRPFTGTAVDAPGAAANARTLANSLSRITLDDVNSAQNPTVLRHPNGAPFSLANSFRGGDIVQNAVGVLGYDFSLYRIMPTGPADYTAVNARLAAPEPVGGTVRVAAMNTLNFFVTPDYPTGNPLDNMCGPLQDVECRGWDSDQVDEFTRQRTKLLSALAGLNADIIGLNELENTTGVEPLASIVSGLPGYAYIDTGTIGTDAIKVGLIYRPSVVTPVGAYQTLDTTDDPRFLDTKNRPALAQTFEVNATGARFTVVVNHLKSKGSACDDVGDPDVGDGQGNCNGTRTLAAQALVDWLATDPTGSGDPDFIIMGDLNSYAMEDPISAIKAGPDDTVGTSDDYTNLISHFLGAYAYSYVFDGQFGYLDHALANGSMLAQVTGVADWHINADEPDVLDYDTSFKPNEQDALYEPNAYRTSDHDPVVVGLNPNAAPSVSAGGPYSVIEGGSVLVSATGSDPNGDALTYAWDLDNNGSFETAGQSASFSAAALSAPGSYTIRVQATDPGGLTAVSQTTVNIIFNFTGFFAPVDNYPTVNTVKAGSAVPIKFSLGGDQGLSIFAVGYPRSQTVTCDLSGALNDVETALNPGSSGLSYSPGADQYNFVWKTSKAWAGTCRLFTVRFVDGTEQFLLFKFK